MQKMFGRHLPGVGCPRLALTASAGSCSAWKHPVVGTPDASASHHIDNNEQVLHIETSSACLPHSTAHLLTLGM